MNKDELIQELVSTIRHLGVDFRLNNSLCIPAIINVVGNQGAYTDSASPYQIAHELFHKIHDDKYRQFNNDIRNPQERDANKDATEFLWNIFISNGGTVEYSQHFLDVSGVPDYQLKRLLEDSFESIIVI